MTEQINLPPHPVARSYDRSGAPEKNKGWTDAEAKAIRAAILADRAARAAAPANDIGAMVNRFLGWPLPKTFSPDCGISFDGRKDDEWNKNKTWPTGTNLFTAEEARQMFEYALGGEGRQGHSQECDDSDALLRHFGLDPEACRTDGGWLNMPKIKSLLAERSAEPAGGSYD